MLRGVDINRRTKASAPDGWARVYLVCFRRHAALHPQHLSATFVGMPRFEDHPIRLHRVRAGLGQARLSQLTGLHRSTISALEEGRVRSADDATVEAIASAMGLHGEDLQRELDAWWAKRAEQPPLLSPTAKAALAGGAGYARSCASFVAWRERFAPSPTAFASLLGVNRAIVAGYERGIRERGMPESLQHALVSRLGIDNDTLLALMSLEPSHD